MNATDRFEDHDTLPIDGAVRLGPDSFCTWTWGLREGESECLLVWHWCTHAKWIERGGDPTLCRPRWAAGGVGAHQLISRDPLHLEPSVYWPDCCGTHGFIRGGAWMSA